MSESHRSGTWSAYTKTCVLLGAGVGFPGGPSAIVKVDDASYTRQWADYWLNYKRRLGVNLCDLYILRDRQVYIYVSPGGVQVG